LIPHLKISLFHREELPTVGKGNVMDQKEVEKRIKDLPVHLVPKVVDYIEFLISKHGAGKAGDRSKKEFSFDWQGGLAELKEQFSSVELQHKSLDWR